MAFSLNHKTVFLLDHGSIFSTPCEQIEFDFHKSRGSGYIPLAPINKTMWTCAAEAVLEYCRIVWDIFTDDKLIRFVVSDHEVKVVNTWDSAEQMSTFVSDGLAACGRPEVETRKKQNAKAAAQAAVAGLPKTLELLSELSPAQKSARASSPAEEGEGRGKKLLNRGRIVCLTHLSDEGKLQQLLSALQDQLTAINARAADDEDEAAVAQLELDLVHCVPPNSSQAAIKPTNGLVELTPALSYQVSIVEAGEGLSKKLLHLALCHYDLASTTVTGIPMKEEQNASSSANYDVELFHKAEAHSRLSGVGDASELVQAIKEGCEYKTVTLKWCTPRGSAAELHLCSSISRITPTDVNSRPSSCLTNFLLGGRSVMLEMPRRSGTKALSHMLTSHGGEIFIHTLAVSRNVLEDPPSISEGPGGRVTDYRITDLGELMKHNRVAPWPGSGGSIVPVERARNRLARFAQCCPLTISSTTIFNMACLEPMQRIMMKDELSEEDLAECRKAIYALLSMESKSEALPVPVVVNSAGKAKAVKKEEQYRIMFAELEKFLVCHARTDRHGKVLDCLLECRNKPNERKSTGAAGGDKVDLDVALREIERCSTGNEQQKSDFNVASNGVLRSTAESPLSPNAKRARSSSALGAGGQSLLDLWNGRQQKELAKKHVPFAGMRSLGEKARLYLSLDGVKEGDAGTPMVVE